MLKITDAVLKNAKTFQVIQSVPVVCVSVCLRVCYVPVCLLVYLSVWLFVCLPVWVFICSFGFFFVLFCLFVCFFVF